MRPANSINDKTIQSADFLEENKNPQSNNALLLRRKKQSCKYENTINKTVQWQCVLCRCVAIVIRFVWHGKTLNIAFAEKRTLRKTASELMRISPSTETSNY